MFIYRLHDAPATPGDTTFRAKSPIALLAFLTPFPIAVSIVLVAATMKGPQFCGIVCCLFMDTIFILSWLHAFKIYRKSRQPSNWLLRSNGTRLLIKFRSYLNNHFSVDDPQIISLAHDEIHWIRETRELRITPSNEGGDNKEKILFLDISLRNTDTRILEALLLAEAARPAPKEGGFIKSTTKYNHIPVRLIPGDILRLTWKDQNHTIKPHITKSVALLSQHYPAFPVHNETNDFSKLAESTDVKKEQRLRDLLATGDRLAAIELARRLYSLSPTQARQKIDNLSSLAPNAPADQLPFQP